MKCPLLCARGAILCIRGELLVVRKELQGLRHHLQDIRRHLRGEHHNSNDAGAAEASDNVETAEATESAMST